jgi:hypothetical protein
MTLFMKKPLLALLATSATLLGSAQAATFFEDFSGGAGGFTVQSTARADNGNPFDSPWIYDGSASFTTGGSEGVAHSRLTSPTLTVTADGAVELSFDHRYSIEGGNWDGGAVFLSVNNAPFEQIPNAAFSMNGYTAFALIGNHDLTGGEGFGGDSPGYGDPSFITSVAAAPFSAGDTVAVQFLMANDEGATGAFLPNWQIDSVSVTNTNAIPEPSSLLLCGLGAVGLLRRRR